MTKPMTEQKDEAAELARAIYDDMETPWVEGDRVPHAEQGPMTERDMARIAAALAAAKEAGAREMRERCVDAIPTSWLDALLTGESRVLNQPPFSGKAIERLLLAIANRLRALPLAPAHEEER